MKKIIASIALSLLCSLSWADPRTKLTVPDILDASALKDGSDGKSAVNPCTDFYQFSCGRWIEETEIPADKTVVYHQATALLDQTDEKLNQLLIRLTQGDPLLKPRTSKQLADFYSSCMNFEKTVPEAEALLKNRIQEINQIQNAKDLARVVSTLHSLGANALFGFGSGQDMDDSSKVIEYVVQAGMALPEPSYYSSMEEKSVKIREDYLQHILKIFVLLGVKEDQANQNAKTVLAFETDLASQAYSKDKRIDPSETHHPMTREDLKKTAPSFDWETYLAGIGAPQSQLNVDEPEFVSHLGEILAKVSLPDLKTYLTWQLVHSVSSKVSPSFESENFQFWSVRLRGAKEMMPRWKICTQAVQDSLGYALAEAYVTTIETKLVRSKIEEMILAIKQVFRDDLNDLTTGPNAWMDQQTMTAALEKLNLLKQKVGAPEKWRDYSSLKTDQTSYLVNYLKVNEFENLRDLEKVGKPVDHSEWEMMPWEINAYYESSKNEFVFPFGILQPPSFDVKASEGANFGAFGGGTIGHELTHGFDNNGRQMDAYGNIREWWTDATKKSFEERSQCFMKQAGEYEIAEIGLKVDGELTLSENLADQGGVKLGYAALLASQSKRKPAPLWLDKYTENQQFWIAYGQSWCTKKTAEALRVQMTTDEHPPSEFRVNGVIMNRPEFARDFGCKEGDRMAPVNRCSIW